ncbi:DUF2971 domain-containing protein [Longivirga aurantiaca]|uniref:DUF2971 domain-containing protein n=1 Tax=Longivirga aurantiaca TaxID=1837743 RepID=A0ABW1T1L4_9ACTN
MRQSDLYELLTGDDNDCVYHYTSQPGLHAILATGSLRLSTFNSLNDPRENKKWMPDELLGHAGDVDDAWFEADRAMEEAVDRLLRRGVRVGCFTETRSSGSGHGLAKGWARPAMWAHYGAAHQGACLVFDRGAIGQAVSDHVPVRDGNLTMCGAVDYTDRELTLPYLGAPSTVVELKELLDAVTMERDVVPSLYLQKNTDWSGEREWRVLVNQWDLPESNLDEPLYVPWEGALLGVVLGSEYGPRVVAERLSGGLPLLTCSWTSRRATLQHSTGAAG